MLLHSSGNEISEDAVSAVLKAAGVGADAARVKALVASLDGVDIADAMTQAVAAPAAAAPVAAAGGDAPAEVVVEEKEEEEAAFGGLGDLFG